MSEKNAKNVLTLELVCTWLSETRFIRHNTHEQIIAVFLGKRHYYARDLKSSEKDRKYKAKRFETPNVNIWASGLITEQN